MEYSIRPLAPGDLPEINAMRIDPRVACTLTSLPTERLEQTRSLLDSTENGEHFFVAVHPSGRVLGVGHLHAESLPRYDHKGSLGLTVAHDAQGRGIGRALMEKMIDLADNWLLLDRLELTVFANNERAIALYRSLGFKDEALARDSIICDGGYQDEIDMARLRPGFHPSLPTESAPAIQPKTAPPIPYSIRPVRREDIRAIADIEGSRGVFENTVSLPSARLVDMENWYAKLNPAYNHCLVAVEKAAGGGEPALLGLVNLHLPPKPRLRHKGDIGLMVSPAAQGRGVGRAMMEAMINVADNWMALHCLELVVFARNSRARALYRSLGFAEQGLAVASAKGDGGYLDEVIMARLRP